MRLVLTQRGFSEAANEVKASEKQSALMKMNMVINGVFHGLALDGIPTLMPVLGATSVSAAVSFLLSYGSIPLSPTHSLRDVRY